MNREKREQSIATLQQIVNLSEPDMVSFYEEATTINEFNDKVNLYGFYSKRFKRQSQIQLEIINILKRRAMNSREQELDNEYEIITREMLIADLEINIASKETWIVSYTNMMRFWNKKNELLALDIKVNGGVTVEKCNQLMEANISNDKKLQLRGLLQRYEDDSNDLDNYSLMLDFILNNPI